MKNVLKSWKGLVLIFALFIAVVALSNKLLKNDRVDLTENGMYTLSSSTLKILHQLDKPVYLNLYFSNAASKELPALRTYEKRVKEFLQEYVDQSNGKLHLRIIDPEPFSVEEDEATAAGLQGVPVGVTQDKVYFGLVGHNWNDKPKPAKKAKASTESSAQQKVDDVDKEKQLAKGDEETIPFFQPNKQAFLEYDISKLVYKLSHPKKPTVGLISNLNMNGGYNFQTGQPSPDWVIVQQMDSQFDVKPLPMTLNKIDKDIDVLMIVHPKDLPPQTQLAIDQYVLGGGHAIVFADPISEAAGSNRGGINIKARRSDMDALLKAWGVKLSEKVVGDFGNSMVVSMGAGHNPARHIGLISLHPDNMDQKDVITNGLDSINLSSAGYLTQEKGATTKLIPLLKSSNQSEPLAASLWENLTNPEDLMKNFKPTGKEYVIAARVQGPAKTAFPDGVKEVKKIHPIDTQKTDKKDGKAKDEKPAKPKEVTITVKPKLTSSKEINLVVVADTDLLTDRLWVQVQQFFGDKIINPWAGNGDFVINALDNLAGNNALISIRNQAKFARPFTRVADLKKAAEKRFYQKQNTLQTRLADTEKKLAELERVRGKKDKALFSPAQEKELESFQQEKLTIRKQLREVQHQLDKDIEELGTRLKLINILLMPLLVCLFALIMFFMKRRKK